MRKSARERERRRGAPRHRDEGEAARDAGDRASHGKAARDRRNIPLCMFDLKCNKIETSSNRVKMGIFISHPRKQIVSIFAKHISLTGITKSNTVF